MYILLSSLFFLASMLVLSLTTYILSKQVRTKKVHYKSPLAEFDAEFYESPSEKQK